MIPLTPEQINFVRTIFDNYLKIKKNKIISLGVRQPYSEDRVLSVKEIETNFPTGFDLHILNLLSEPLEHKDKTDLDEGDLDEVPF